MEFAYGKVVQNLMPRDFYNPIVIKDIITFQAINNGISGNKNGARRTGAARTIVLLMFKQ